ncbi:MAG: beta-ketoacyl synthase N-terminal-like domain-containing protein [Methyloversatilis sp.]|nr:beta-ketoacyl synthase N-terminal-like domain-containing protein [Methyloversatilis sp.]
MKDMLESHPGDDNAEGSLDIALIGMAGRFPGAASVDAYWRNLIDGVESIVELDAGTLRAQGLDDATLNDPAWKRVGAPIDGSDLFDAGFFGYSPREAEILDPQQRLFLECAWHALEDAGHDPAQGTARIGVFGGAGMNGYLFNVYGNARLRGAVSPYELFLSNDKDFLTTRVSYKLGLTGPSVAVQTACSTSLVAVHLACQSLLAGECDMALAGGVALSRQLGYRVQQGGIHAPDGHCRAFDADAAGTVPGNGVALVVLRRLDDALRDGDRIVATIKGSAINNDGAGKVSFTAPGVDAQSEAIASALSAAGVSPDTVGYVEAHGTGTALGDPIEIAALTRAFGRPGQRPDGPCFIGSVKTNIGHLDAAAGVAGLIKAACAVRDGVIPASLHFRTPNPHIDFARTPFRVAAERHAWTAPLRRAGVSSFGIGGSNAHVVLEQPPVLAPTPDARPQLLPLSARSDAALATLADALARHLEHTPGATLADVAWTLQLGRRGFARRGFVVAGNAQQAIAALRAVQPAAAPERSSLLWLFTGQGSQKAGMARALYDDEPVFRAALERCAARLDARLGCSLIDLLCSDDASSAALLDQTRCTQPALFAFEYALAQLWLSRGVKPQALLGHSLGEYVAACIAGIFEPEQALDVVALRAQAMQDMAPGVMLAVMAGAEAVADWLDGDSAVAAVNVPGTCVLAGPEASMARCELHAQAAGIACQRLRTSHAFHAPGMRAAADALAGILRDTTLRPPQIPVISNLTGDWLSAEQATDPDYWAQHMLGRVRFADGLARAATLPALQALEIGPGDTLALLARQNGIAAVASLAPREPAGRALLQAQGALWQAGVSMDWRALHRGRRLRVSLPGYPFERQRYHVDAPDAAALQAAPAASEQGPARAWLPAWTRVARLAALPPVATQQTWLLIADREGLAETLARQIETAGFNVFIAQPGDAFSQLDYRAFALRPAQPEDHGALRAALDARGMTPAAIVDCTALDGGPADAHIARLRALAIAWAEGDTPMRLSVLTRRGCAPTGLADVDAEQAALQAMTQVIPQEYPQIGARLIDIDDAQRHTAEALWALLRTADAPPLLALRGDRTWRLDYTPLELPALPAGLNRGVRKRGRHVVIGDFARGLGAVWARRLARECGQVVLVSACLPTAPVPAALIAECRALGADVTVLEADIPHPAGIASAFDSAASAQALAGIFVSLPTTHEQSAAPLALMQPDHLAYNRRSRLELLAAVAAAAQAHAPAWVCVQSSLSAVLGGIGLAPYAAANHMLDAEVLRCAAAGGRTAWYAIQWDAARSHEHAPAQEGGRAASLQEHALDDDDIWTLTTALLALAEPGVYAASRGDLQARRLHWLHSEGRAAQQTPAGAAAYARPALTTAYEAPRNEVERTIAALWQELLRLERIGIHDSFFDLGGHSLLAIQAIGRLRQAFPVQLELRELLDGTPTVAGIAALVSAQLPDAQELDRMAALLAEIDALSGDEVIEQLAAQSAPTPEA